MAIGGGGAFTTVHATEHATTNAQVIQKFIKAGVIFRAQRSRCLVEVSTPF